VANERKGRIRRAIDALIPELAELRDLGSKRHPRGPRPDADPAADDDIDRRARELMDHFRDPRVAQGSDRFPLAFTAAAR
jgi:hypothetical protein